MEEKAAKRREIEENRILTFQNQDDVVIDEKSQFLPSELFDEVVLILH